MFSIFTQTMISQRDLYEPMGDAYIKWLLLTIVFFIKNHCGINE